MRLAKSKYLIVDVRNNVPRPHIENRWESFLQHFEPLDLAQNIKKFSLLNSCFHIPSFIGLFFYVFSFI
jgi:hypothetical protein